jgi:Fe-S-cluster-containing dehydrogenase component
MDSGILEFLVEHRYINGTATMLVDLDRCTRCDECVLACARAHDNNPRFNRHGRRHDHYMVANACMHCMDPVCMIGCPTGAIHRASPGGQVVINDTTCIGCATCAGSCPYDNIRMVEVRDGNGAFIRDTNTNAPIAKATKCDLCLDQPGGPACQRACPHDALKRVDMQDLSDLGRWLNR